jgi:deoxyribodipyrimidine photo-lyase
MLRLCLRVSFLSPRLSSARLYNSPQTVHPTHRPFTMAVSASKRSVAASSSDDESKKDVKMTEASDSDGPKNRIAKKRKGTDGKIIAPDDSKIDYAQSDKIGSKSKTAPKRNDFNPNPNTLPEKTTPTQSLRDALKKQEKPADQSGNVVFWMGMRDLRIEDNRALARASELVQEHKKKNKSAALIGLHIISPQDYLAHERSPRRIDFSLRNLKHIQRQLEDEYNIPFYVMTHEPRTDVGNKALELCKEWQASNLVLNMEHEVDELWRNIKLVESSKKYNLYTEVLDDAYVVPPGDVLTKDGRPYSVFSPWNRNWVDILSKHPEHLEEAPLPKANDKSVRSDGKLKSLFGSKIPDKIKQFECPDTEYLTKLWPEGHSAAQRVLENFIKGKGGDTIFDGPATDYAKGNVDDGSKESRLARYQNGRNIMSENGTSRISPYLSAGVISARECLRRMRAVTKGKLQVGRDSGPAAYGIEISFRDFYAHVLAAWPRVCMGRAYLTKFEDVVWERDEETLLAWQEGRTGYPIVDASMRQAAKQGYMHNRGRMIVAMFLTKHLMHDWREGERWFMQNLIDGDFASNNGGWQWSASTGTDPQPIFRIFNPLSQSEKCDPDGEYIRHWVPELADIKTKAVHAPHERLSKDEFKKLNYPEPIVEYKFGRERALHRFKNIGEK